MAGFWDREEHMGTIPKNNKEEIQVKKVTKNGKHYVDIRTFWMDPETDEFKPSQKGVAVPFESIEELKKILDKA